MHLNSFIILILISSFVFGCASNSDKKFIDTTDTELIKIFEIKDDKFKQFQVEEAGNSVEKVVKEPKVKEVASKSNKLKIKVKTQKNIKHKKEKKKIIPQEKIKSRDSSEVKKDNKVTLKKRKVEGPKEPEIPEELRKTFLGYDKKSKQVWDLFSPRIFPGEEILLKIKFLGLTAGFVKLTTHSVKKINNRLAYHFVAKLKTARYYSYIYSLDDSVETFVDKENFQPIKYTLIQRESGQSVDDLQLFDMDSQKTYNWYKRTKKGKIKQYKKVEFVPKYLQDSFSVLFFVRGLPLKIGDKYSFPIVTRGKIWLLDIKVDKFETINVNGDLVPTIKIMAETRFPGVLKKKGDIVFWYSKTKERKLLKFKAKVKIGSIEGDLIEYKPGKN